MRICETQLSMNILFGRKQDGSMILTRLWAVQFIYHIHEVFIHDPSFPSGVADYTQGSTYI